MRAGFFGQLRQRAVVVEAGHRGEVARVEIRRGGLGDERVGVGRVADDQYFDVARGVVVQRLALRAEDGAVRGEQILALHAGAARTGADQERVIAVLEGDIGVVGGDKAAQQREGAIVEFHGNALECVQRRGDFQQLQDDGLVRAEHIASCDAESERIADIAGSAGDGDANGVFHEESPVCLGKFEENNYSRVDSFLKINVRI